MATGGSSGCLAIPSSAGSAVMHAWHKWANSPRLDSESFDASLLLYVTSHTSIAPPVIFKDLDFSARTVSSNALTPHGPEALEKTLFPLLRCCTDCKQHKTGTCLSLRCHLDSALHPSPSGPSHPGGKVSPWPAGAPVWVCAWEPQVGTAGSLCATVGGRW